MSVLRSTCVLFIALSILVAVDTGAAARPVMTSSRSTRGCRAKPTMPSSRRGERSDLIESAVCPWDTGAGIVSASGRGPSPLLPNIENRIETS